MREETRQHEGTLTWDLFQSTLIEHFYHISGKERATCLLNKLQQDPHENIGEYMQRGSKIIQVHSPPCFFIILNVNVNPYLNCMQLIAS